MPITTNKTREELIELANYFYPKEIFMYLGQDEENQLLNYFSVLSKISELDSKEVECSEEVRTVKFSLLY